MEILKVNKGRGNNLTSQGLHIETKNALKFFFQQIKRLYKIEEVYNQIKTSYGTHILIEVQQALARNFKN